MRITDLAVRNGPFMLVLCLLLVALGLVAWQKIPRAEDPAFPISSFTVVLAYPGADPLEVEQQVLEPVEQALRALDDLKEIVATADAGMGVVRVDFEAHIDTERTYDALQRELDGLARTLPEGLAGIEIRRANPGNVNIVQYALVSDTAPEAQLQALARELEDRFERVPGIREAQTWACPQREVRVELDLERLAMLRLRPEQVLAALGAGSRPVPGGAVEAGGRRLSLAALGGYRSLQQVGDTPIPVPGATPLRLRDVAQLRWDSGPQEYLARLDGRRAVYVTATQKPGRNIFDSRAQLQEAAAQLGRRLPAGVTLEPGFDQARHVERRLGRLGSDLLIAIALVLLTLLPLGLRVAGVVMVSIPLSLATGLAALYLAGHSLNQLSIAGFIIALGLLVDDSIVVAENIARHRRLGCTPQQAATRATRQVALAVAGCTVTLLFAFLPLLALSSNSGRFIRPLPLAVLLTVAASLLVALTVIPYLASRLLGPAHAPQGNALLQGLTRLINRAYTPLLRRALAHPRRTLLLSAAACALVAGLVPVMGTSLFPAADTPQFLVQVRLPGGAGLQATDAVTREVEALLRRQPQVSQVLANVGHGNPQVFYNVTPQERAAHYAELLVQLAAYDPVHTRAFYRRLRRELDAIAGAEILLKEFENGPPLEAPVSLRVVGPELDTLRRLAGELEQLMRDTPGLRNLGNPLRRGRTDLRLAVDADKAALLGLSPAEVGQGLRLAVAGLLAGELHADDGERYPIVLRAPGGPLPGPEALQAVHLATPAGGRVPLAQVARLELGASPARLLRRNGERAVALTAHTEPGYNRGVLTRQLLARAATLELPAGYRIEAGGESQRSKESFSGLGAATLVAVAGILATLVLQFGSFRSTLIAAAVIPLGLAGGVLLLFACGYDLSFTAMIGCIALIGIEIKNSILLVDFTQQLRAEGLGLLEAIEQAGEVRFLPILLTSVTAIGGMLPLALQHSPLYSPMALVIIGGLLSSTLLGRLLTPVMYRLLPPPAPGRSAAAE